MTHSCVGAECNRGLELEYCGVPIMPDLGDIFQPDYWSNKRRRQDADTVGKSSVLLNQLP